MCYKQYIKWEKVMFRAEPRYMKYLMKKKDCCCKKKCNNDLLFVCNEKYFAIATTILLFDFSPLDDLLSHDRISL